MAQIRYLVPYQIDVLGQDTVSLKRIGNTLYYISGVQAASPPAYGAPIAGGGSTTTLLANFDIAWQTLVAAVLHGNYTIVSYTMRAIVGYGYGTPVLAINALIQTGTFTTIQTASPHGLSTGDIIRVSGVTTPANTNGLWSVIVVTANQVQISPSGTGVWSNDGSIQRADGQQNFQYADLETLAGSAGGGVSGEAMPTFVSVDVQRLNPGIGKSFRSRFGMSMISEDDQKEGKLTAPAQAIWGTNLPLFFAPLVNGGSGTASDHSYLAAVSKKKASMIASPFVTSNGWTQYVSSLLQHNRLGSQNQRKPKLAGS